MTKTTYIANGLIKFQDRRSELKITGFNGLTFSSKDEIKETFAETFKRNSTLGFITKGAVIEIVKETKIEDEDEVFFEREFSFDSIGDLTDHEYFELQEKILNKTN